MICHRSGSPSMEDIEAFSTTYRARLDEAELAKSIPENLSLEVFCSFLVVSLVSFSFFIYVLTYFINLYGEYIL